MAIFARFYDLKPLLDYTRSIPIHPRAAGNYADVRLKDQDELYHYRARANMSTFAYFWRSSKSVASGPMSSSGSTSFGFTSSEPTSPGSTSSTSTLVTSSSSGSSSTLTTSTSATSSSPTSTESKTTSSSIYPTLGNSTPTAIPSTHHGSTVSGGVAAGIAIGTFIIGALLALGGFWFFSRQRKRSRRPRETTSSNDYSKRTFSAGNGIAASKEIDTPMQDYPIVERADDSQLRNQMQNLGELIYQHVENHTAIGPYTGTSHDFTAGLTKCGYSERTEPTASTLGSLLANSKERRTGIKSLIAWVILRGVDLKSSSEYSLLPDEITGFYRAVFKGDKRLHEQDALSKSLSQWRQLSAHLLSSTHSKQGPPKDSSITKVVNLLNSILQPFIKPDSNNSQSQSDNLASIICEGKEFGMLLLEQPGAWMFGWETTSKMGSRAENQIVVFPSLEEVIQRSGKERRRVVCEQDREGVV
ncbi:hypothetical protein SBOR_5253 [Sclerotinia borealis F-4128]|uniref:Uncharacterized protein n=1 Tax=Sclerotinia borealis (strain F-4128) TaxID=1432307 RepID=W9CI88_SCLBF|nr:hypothetical protein SBOR_5253 [Sclerotinia borealis F-4128]